MSNVSLITEYLPKSERITIGRKFVTLSHREYKIPILWDFSQHPLLLQFFGYWLGKGVFERFGVSISCGKDVADLIPIFDYVAELFKCNYRIKVDKVVRFDSAALKYTMLGLEFGKIAPSWITKQLSPEEGIEILRGYFTAYGKFDKGPTPTLSVKEKMPESGASLGLLLSNISIGYTENSHQIIINSVSDLEKFYMDVGFLSEKKNVQMHKLLF